MSRELPPPATPLLALLRELETDDRRRTFAALTGTSVDYLYQLATCQRKSCRAPLAKSIADASVVMSRKFGTVIVTMDELAVMCACRAEPT